MAKKLFSPAAQTSAVATGANGEYEEPVDTKMIPENQESAAAASTAV